jgi:hypothetical protein
MGSFAQPYGWINQAARGMGEVWRSRALPDAFYTSEHTKDRYPFKLSHGLRMCAVWRIGMSQPPATRCQISDHRVMGVLSDVRHDSLVRGSYCIARIPSRMNEIVI